MSKKLLLVDLENVQQFDLRNLDQGFKVVIFVGAGQKSVSIDLVTRLQGLPNKVEWVRVPSHGKNALDLFIAYWIGRNYAVPKNRDVETLILSRDKGYDALTTYLQTELELSCRRIDNLSQLVLAASETTATRRVGVDEYDDDEVEV